MRRGSGVAGQGHSCPPPLACAAPPTCTAAGQHRIPQLPQQQPCINYNSPAATSAHRARARAGFSANCFLTHVAICTAG